MSKVRMFVRLVPLMWEMAKANHVALKSTTWWDSWINEVVKRRLGTDHFARVIQLRLDRHENE